MVAVLGVTINEIDLAIERVEAHEVEAAEGSALVVSKEDARLVIDAARKWRQHEKLLADLSESLSTKKLEQARRGQAQRDAAREHYHHAQGQALSIDERVCMHSAQDWTAHQDGRMYCDECRSYLVRSANGQRWVRQ